MFLLFAATPIYQFDEIHKLVFNHTRKCNSARRLLPPYPFPEQYDTLGNNFPLQFICSNLHLLHNRLWKQGSRQNKLHWSEHRRNGDLIWVDRSSRKLLKIPGPNRVHTHRLTHPRRIVPEVILVALGDLFVDRRLPCRVNSVLDTELIAPCRSLSPACHSTLQQHCKSSGNPRQLAVPFYCCRVPCIWGQHNAGSRVAEKNAIQQGWFHSQMTIDNAMCPLTVDTVICLRCTSSNQECECYWDAVAGFQKSV